MKKYQPELMSRIAYARKRDSIPFRAVQRKVIDVLNPHKDPELKIQELHYSTDPKTFVNQRGAAFQRAVRAMGLYNEALKLLDSVKAQRAREQSPRWRANYDLMHAQCQAYRVRLFQFLLALDQHQKKQPAPRRVNGVENNVWNAVRQKELLPPDPALVKLTKVEVEALAGQMEAAVGEFQAVIEEHPQTPWARRAKEELSHGFGVTFLDEFYDFAQYAKARDVKLPNP